MLSGILLKTDIPVLMEVYDLRQPWILTWRYITLFFVRNVVEFNSLFLVKGYCN